MFSFLKPKWQHRQPNIRIEAIQSGLDSEIVLRIAKSDQDMNVRIAAFQAISHVKELQVLLLQEPSDKGRKVILKRALTLIAEMDDPVAAINSLIESSQKSLSLFDVIMICPHPLKTMIFPLMNKEREINQLLTNHYSFTLAELQMIDAELLPLVARNHQSNDKKVTSFLKDILQTAELAERRVERKKILLEHYESLASAEDLAALNVFSELENEWNALELGQDNQVLREKYLERYHAQNKKRQEKYQELQNLEQIITSDVSDPINFDEISQQLELLKNEDVFSMKERNHVNQLIQQVQAAQLEFLKAKEEIQRKANIDANESLKNIKKEVKKVELDNDYVVGELEKLDELIRAGELQAANELHKVLNNYLQEAAKNKQQGDYTRQLKQLAEPLMNQMDTVRWSILQGLEYLCDRSEDLTSEDHSVDYIALTLKQLREDWNESRKGLKFVPHKLHNRFEQACQKAYQKVMDARNKDNEARKVYLEEANDLLTTLAAFVDQIDWGNPDWSMLMDTRQKFFQDWNLYLEQYSTDGVLSYGAPLFLHRDKAKLERRMRQIIKPVEQNLQKERKAEKKRRQDEIAELKDLLMANEIRGAVEKAKQYNKSFVPNVRSSRHEENLLWKELRVINDQIFASRQAILSVEEGERNQNAQLKIDILEALKSLALTVNEESSVGEINAQLSQYEDEWFEIGVVPKKDYDRLENAFKLERQKIKEAIESLVNSKNQRERLALLDQAQAISLLEKRALQSETFEIEDHLKNIMHNALKKRVRCLEQIQSGQDSALSFLRKKSSDAVEKMAELVILREILLDKVSAEEDKEKRLALQVQILESAMNNSRSDKDVARQLQQMDDEWLEKVVGVESPTHYQRFR